MNIFTVEDFSHRVGHADSAAEVANARLDQIVKDMTWIYSTYAGGCVWTTTKHDNQHFKARLAFIERIKSEKCDHVPVGDGLETVCCHCGRKLKAKWEECE